VGTVSTPFGDVWPSELDRRARRADLTLRARRGGGSGEPRTSDSRAHSVSERPRVRRAGVAGVA